MDNTAKKFVSSLVKSLQILCNGHLEFTDGIELVGHISVNIDKKCKFNCLLDELVSKQANDSTTFFSHSYHSLPPSNTRSTKSKEDDNMQVLLQTFQQSQSSSELGRTEADKDSGDFSVAVDSPNKNESSIIKMEGDESDEGLHTSSFMENQSALDPAEQNTGFRVSDWMEEETRKAPIKQEPGSSAAHFLSAEANNSPIPDHRLDHFPSMSPVQASRGREKGPQQSTSARTLHVCSHCQCLFDSLHHFTAHLGSKDCQGASLAYLCSQCDFTSSDKALVDRHLLETHKSIVKTFPCDQCSARFHSASGLRVHRQTKHLIAPTFQCSICGKVLHNKINLDGHINQHKGLKPHGCSFCGKTFSYKQSQKAHEKLCYERGVYQ